MKQKRLNGLLTMFIEQELTNTRNINVDQVITIYGVETFKNTQ